MSTFLDEDFLEILTIFWKFAQLSRGCNFFASYRTLKRFILLWFYRLRAFIWHTNHVHMLKTHFARVFFVKYQHIFPLHEGVCLCGHARHGAPRGPTSGGRNFCASGRNRTKPPPNENYEFIFSFDEGFVWFWPLDQKLWPPEVGQYFRKYTGAPRAFSVARTKNIKKS